MTRIVAGRARGRRLAVPPRGTRPTSDRVRESLFSALDSALQRWAGLRVLDLYAGSGALGLEALSRGAAEVLLVEKDRRAADVARANVTAVGLPGATVLQRPVESVVAAAAGTTYGLVLADPPYDLAAEQLVSVLEALHGNGWLAPEAVVVLERSSRDEAFPWSEAYVPERSRSYGETTLWYGRAAGHSGPATGEEA